MSEERTPYLAGGLDDPPRLTPRRYQLLAFLARYELEHGYGASLDEMAAHLGVHAPSTVAEFLDRLVDLGCVSRGPKGAARAVRVTLLGSLALRPRQLATLVDQCLADRFADAVALATAPERKALTTAARLLGFAAPPLTKADSGGSR